MRWRRDQWQATSTTAASKPRPEHRIGNSPNFAVSERPEMAAVHRGGRGRRTPTIAEVRECRAERRAARRPSANPTTTPSSRNRERDPPPVEGVGVVWHPTPDAARRQSGTAARSTPSVIPHSATARLTSASNRQASATPSPDGHAPLGPQPLPQAPPTTSEMRLTAGAPRRAVRGEQSRVDDLVARAGAMRPRERATREGEQPAHHVSRPRDSRLDHSRGAPHPTRLCGERRVPFLRQRVRAADAPLDLLLLPGLD